MHAAKKKESAPAETKKQGGAKEKKPESSPSHVNPLWLQLATGFENPAESYAGDSSLRVQAKLAVGSPDDPLEREADDVAATVLRMPNIRTRKYAEDEKLIDSESQTEISDESPPPIRRMCFPCNGNGQTEPDELPLVQKKSNPSSSLALSTNRSTSLSIPTNGSPLPDNVRSRIEPVLGTDLRQVRVHDDPNDREQARSLNARAFTHGNHIWLGPNQRADDVGLMAHEATHLVQQSTGSFNKIQRNLCSSQIIGETGDQQGGSLSSWGELSEEQRTERGRQQASATPPGAQHRNVAEQVREHQRRQEEPDQIGPTPLRGIVVRAPNWRFFEGRDVPIANWEATTGDLSFVSIPIPELLTEIEIGGNIRAFTHINAGYGPGQLRNIDLELSQRQSVLYQLGSFFCVRPDMVNASMLRYFGDFRGQADIHIPARFNARLGLRGALQALAELLGIIDLASIRGGLEANATAQTTLEYHGRIYFTYHNGAFQFGFQQNLPLQIDLGFGLDAFVGGSFGIWPVDYEWEKRWRLACWRWRRLWQLNPSMTIAYNQSSSGGGASAFDSDNAFVLNFEDIPVNDLISLIEELVGDNAPGELEQRPSEPCDDPLNIRWPYELPLPDGPRPLVRRGSGEYDDDSRGSIQRQMSDEINERVELGLPLDDIACTNRMNDSEPIGAFDAHHKHPLAFGGQDQEFNLCALRRHLHEAGHRKLRFQRDMVGTDSTWINCGVTEPDLYRHPSGQWYEITGRK